MKKFLIFITLFLQVVLFTYADEREGVKLNDKDSKKTIEFVNCNISVTKGETDDDGNTKVTIEIENKDESEVVILFGHAYPEKELKRLSPSIRFDKKKYPRTNRNIETIKGGKDVLFIEPGENKFFSQGIQIKKEEKYSCRLPFYIAYYKPKSFWTGSNGRNKLQILEKQTLELEIEVEVKPDEDYIRLERECKDLIEEVGKVKFCPNTKHKPSLEEQKAQYIERINKIVVEKNAIINRHKWLSSDNGYKRYDELMQNIGKIKFEEVDCGRHSSSGTRSREKCKYCDLSPQQIYHKLDDFYKKIYSSNNRKAAKEGIMSDVNLLYNCSRHSGAWKKSDYKSKITDRYNKICNF